MSHISFLLGAGFSVPAGLPVVKTISDYFIRKPFFNQVYHYSSSEWAWKEFANNGSVKGGPLSNIHITIACFVEQLVQDYLKSINGNVLNYENFYEWMIRNLYQNESFDKTIESVKEKFKEYNFGCEISLVDKVNKGDIVSCVYHLISNLLVVRKGSEELLKIYAPYIDIISAESNEISVLTLNHDTLFETLLNKLEIQYDNGFSTVRSSLVGDNKNILPIFDNTFNSRVNVFKLHGAINQIFLQ